MMAKRKVILIPIGGIIALEIGHTVLISNKTRLLLKDGLLEQYDEDGTEKSASPL